MIKAVTVGAVAHTHTGKSILQNKKHKDMKYLCDFKICKII